MNEDALYMCFWGEGYIDEPDPIIHVVYASHFCEEKGYDDQDITNITQLRVAQSFTLPDHNAHCVVRIK